MNFASAVRRSARRAKLPLMRRVKLQIILSVPNYRQKLYDELLLKAIECEVVPVSTTMNSTIAADFDWEKFENLLQSGCLSSSNLS